MKEVALALCLVACGGPCIPREATSAASFAVDVAPTVDVHIVSSSAELDVMIDQNTRISFPSTVARQEADTGELSARQRLIEFRNATNFATTDIAMVRAGGARSSLRGIVTSGATTTIFFSSSCSPCAGGNPGSYEQAREAEEAGRAERTELVRVPKNTHVVAKECTQECGTCPSNVP